jgi:hypothetical protein
LLLVVACGCFLSFVWHDIWVCDRQQRQRDSWRRSKNKNKESWWEKNAQTQKVVVLSRVAAVESKKEDKQQACSVANQQVLLLIHERLLELGHDVCDEIGEYSCFLCKRQVWQGCILDWYKVF